MRIDLWPLGGPLLLVGLSTAGCGQQARPANNVVVEAVMNNAVDDTYETMAVNEADSVGESPAAPMSPPSYQTGDPDGLGEPLNLATPGAGRGNQSAGDPRPSNQ